MKALLLVLFVGAVSFAAELSPDVKIISMDRKLDMTSQVVKEEIELEIENTGSKAFSEYIHAVPKSDEKHVAFIGIDQLDGDKKKRLKVESATISGRSDEVFYAAKLQTSLATGKKSKLSITVVYTHLLNPYPSHITQDQQQLVVYEGSATAGSAYAVVSQKTTVKLATSTVESYTKDKAVSPVNQDGSTIVYGPYENTPAFTSRAVRIHYENNTPFLTITRLERVIEVSHWGNIAVEETYEMVHTGAQLKGSFSRYDYQRDHRQSMPCVKSFKTLLPAAAADVYYRDEIGNISTSHLKNREDSVELEVTPRFPLFGGWKTQYYIGYNVPSYEYLHVDGSKFLLQMRFIDHILDYFVVDEMTLKIILPERTKNIQFQAPYPVKRSPNEVHYTYLDYQGRPVVIAHKSNLVESHIQLFQLDYSFDRVTMIFEPMILVSAFYLLFLLVIVYVRLDFTIAKDATSEARLKVTGLLDMFRSTHEERLTQYDGYIDAIEKCKNSKDTTALTNARKRLDVDLKRTTQQVSDYSTQVKADSPDTAEKLGELQKYDGKIREQLLTWASAVERLVTGKINKQQYQDVEKQSRTKIEEWRGKMESAAYGL